MFPNSSIKRIKMSHQSSISPSSVTTFPPKTFCDLPPEVRQEIWKLAAQAPVEGICFYTGAYRYLEAPKVQQPFNLSLMLTCSESYDIVVKTGRIPRRDFDPDVDIFWITNHSALSTFFQMTGGKIKGWRRTAIDPTVLPEWIPNMKHLAISLPQTDWTYYDPNNDQIIHCLGRLTSLKTLTVVFPQHQHRDRNILWGWRYISPWYDWYNLISVPSTAKRKVPYRMRTLTYDELREVRIAGMDHSLRRVDVAETSVKHGVQYLSVLKGVVEDKFCPEISNQDFAQHFKIWDRITELDICACVLERLCGQSRKLFKNEKPKKKRKVAREPKRRVGVDESKSVRRIRKTSYKKESKKTARGV